MTGPPAPSDMGGSANARGGVLARRYPPVSPNGRLTARITEPATLLTDYALAAWNAVLGLRLLRAGGGEGRRAVRLWAAAFFSSAAGALLGGTSHGFSLYLSPVADRLLWKGTVYAIGLAGFFLLAGTIVASISRPWRSYLLAAVVAKLLLYAGWMATHDAFRYVIYDYVPSLLAVAILQASRRREPGAAWVLGGVAVSFLAAGVQRSGLKLHESFNHNDLYHAIQMSAVWLFYQGARRLRDRA